MSKTSCNTVVIYHKNCNDGFGAAFAHWYWNTKAQHTEYVPMQYGEEIPACIKAESDVIFLDFALTLEATTQLCNRVKSVTVIDHHKTSLVLQDLHLPNFNLVHDIGKSGAVLTWNCFAHTTNGQRPIPPLLLQYVQDRDLWQFKYPDCKAFHLALSSFSKDFECWLDLLEEQNLQELIDKGVAMLTFQKAVLSSLMRDAYIGTIQGEMVFMANCPPILSSDMADLIFTEYPKAKVACVFSITGNYVKYSLRNNNALPKHDWVDVSALAEKYNGGGHASAAGFSLRIEESHLMREGNLR